MRKPANRIVIPTVKVTAKPCMAPRTELSSPLALRVAVPAVVVGLALVVAGLSLGWGVGVLGALLSTGGLVPVVREAGRRLRFGRTT